jgi:hypothetical protein
LRLIRPKDHDGISLAVEEPALREPGHIVADGHAAHGIKVRRLDLANRCRLKALINIRRMGGGGVFVSRSRR